MFSKSLLLLWTNPGERDRVGMCDMMGGRRFSPHRVLASSSLQDPVTIEEDVLQSATLFHFRWPHSLVHPINVIQ